MRLDYFESLFVFTVRLRGDPKIYRPGGIAMTGEALGAITYPKRFLASGVRAGIKETGEDMALILSELPASAAAVFTRNVVKAACVQINRSRVPSDSIRAVLVNSGNANSYTGEQGMRDALNNSSTTASLLGVDERDVLIASTGIIGQLLPMDKMTVGIAQAVAALSRDGGAMAARAIMTTDTRPKEAVAEFSVGGVTVRVGGMVKGAGMICPNMATMLAFITTDAVISPQILQSCLSASVERSFNCLTIDGDSSTNDMLVVLANGAAGNAEIRADSESCFEFQRALDLVTTSLAKQIARDGEGATKMVEITVTGARSFEDARQIAKTIANSPLVKTAMFGSDPNWGRVLAAAGRAGVDFDPRTVNLRFGETVLVRSGEPVAFDEEHAHEYLTGAEVRIVLEVGNGPGSATVWTCDFSYDYVRINAEYHT
jgi:glutamate N-acetyltransferase/amino-acid N-acetyltransferase